MNREGEKGRETESANLAIKKDASRQLFDAFLKTGSIHPAMDLSHSVLTFMGYSKGALPDGASAAL